LERDAAENLRERVGMDGDLRGFGVDIDRRPNDDVA
jgi:hypothetical protein